MNRTKIPWVVNPDGSQGFTSNPVRGQCLHHCPYCYAEKIRKRYKHPAELSWHPEELDAIRKRKKPSTIFIGSMYDIWGKWVPEEYKTLIVQVAELCNQHKFLFLTKNAEDYEDNPALDNVWYGITDDCRKESRIECILGFFDPEMKIFMSYEPLLGLPVSIPRVDWIIIGSLNENGKAVPVERGGTRLEWVTPILEEADKLKIPVFIKPELAAMYPSLPVRKDLPYLTP